MAAAADQDSDLPQAERSPTKRWLVWRQQHNIFWRSLEVQEAWAVEEVQLNTHNGTHMDAPWHYHSTMDGGEPAWTIDQAPLDWCFRPGVKLDFRHLEDGYVARAADVQAELARIGHELAPLDIVVVNTSAGAAYGEPDYMHRGCGMGREFDVTEGPLTRLHAVDEVAVDATRAGVFGHRFGGALLIGALYV